MDSPAPLPVGLTARLRAGWHLARVAPRLCVIGLRDGMLPMVPLTAATLVREGPRALHWKLLGDALARVLRRAGPVPAKLGQLLATRDDLLPPDLCRRLETLYAGQPAMPRASVERILQGHFGKRRPFKRFSWKPIAVGSVGQVHRARLRDGSKVVVKLLRPDAAQAIERDVAALVALVDGWLSLSRAPRRTRERAFRALSDLGEGFALEVDLRHEAEALQEFGTRLARNPRVYVPRCYPEWSSPDLLVLEELEGVPLCELREHGDAQARSAARSALREILSQVFEDGRFHADPHGGNLLWLPDGRLGLIDLGLTGELTRGERRRLAAAVRALFARDVDAAIEALLAFGQVPDEFDAEAFRCDVVATFASTLRDTSPDRLERAVQSLLEQSHRHGVYVPRSSTLLIKTLVTIEGVARSLDPDLNVVRTALPVLLRSLRPRWLRVPRFGRRG